MRAHDGPMTDTATHTTALQPDDPRWLFARAVMTATAAVDAVRPEQLTDPTPCTQYDVRQVLGHLVDALHQVARLGRGADPFAADAATARDDDWSAAWREAAHGVQAAWSDDAVLERPMALPWLQGTGADVLASYLSEVTVHTWDVATATGQVLQWDDEVVQAALDQRAILPAEGRRQLFERISAEMGLDEVAVPFADAVPVPEGAPAIDRLVAWSGRHPA